MGQTKISITEHSLGEGWDDRTGDDKPVKMPRKAYEKALHKLQVELCYLQDWVKSKGLRIIIVFEGRDAAGKGGVIKAITERVSPRVFRVVALPAPSAKVGLSARSNMARACRPNQHSGKPLGMVRDRSIAPNSYDQICLPLSSGRQCEPPCRQAG